MAFPGLVGLAFKFFDMLVLEEGFCELYGGLRDEDEGEVPADSNLLFMQLLIAGEDVPVLVPQLGVDVALLGRVEVLLHFEVLGRVSDLLCNLSEIEDSRIELRDPGVDGFDDFSEAKAKLLFGRRLAEGTAA